MQKKILITLLILVVLGAGAVFAYQFFSSSQPQEQESETSQTTSTEIEPDDKQSEIGESDTDKQSSALATPIEEFKARITKKRFGTYVTPGNSPTPPEKFSGFHTGVDVEYVATSKEIGVRAITNGTVTYSGVVSGYGGVALVTHTIRGVPRTVVYGHLDPASVLPVGTKVSKGQSLGRLGDNRSAETDGERKHLHFAILTNTRQDFKGYVSSKSQLSGWMNPLTLF